MILQTNLIQNHKQCTAGSCVPMSVECVLKLLNLMPESDFSLQTESSYIGTSDWINPFFPFPKINPKVHFKREFLLTDIDKELEDRGQHFMKNYFVKLFKTIDGELDDERFVIISLESGHNTWHNYVIFEKLTDVEYKTVTFSFHDNGPIIQSKDLQEIVSKMEGTDILTYKWI